MKLVVLACLFAAAFAAPELNVFLKGWKHVGEWEEFKKTYQKSYSTNEEELKRFQIFADHSEKIEKHNAEEALDGRHGFKTGINEYADLSTEEFVKMFNNFKPTPKTGNAITYLEPDNLQMPETVDWRQKGYVTGVKNQGQCGSCWSFSTTGSLEGQHFKKTGELVSLSEQNLVDCSGEFGNQGCNGGLMDQAFEYIKANGGIDTEASYPYTARDGYCHYNPANRGATVTGYVDIPAKDEASLQSAVASAGPVSVAIDASHWSFQMYKSGVYNEGACSQTALDHGVLAVGYGTDNGNAYWLVKNSWGTTWGMEGYIMMSRNANNQCGIATMASYPTV